MNYIKQHRHKATSQQAGSTDCDCNYSDNYYGDRVCKPASS
jgi:hypothetical protein